MRSPRMLWALISFLMVQSSFASNEVKMVPGELIVKLKSTKALSALKDYSVFKSVKGLDWKFGNFALVKISEDKTNKIMNFLNNDPNVMYAEPNYIVEAIGKSESLTANDPRFSKLWGLHNTGNNEPRSSRGNSSPNGVKDADINALNAWTITKGSKDIVIAVIDTGIDYNHEDLKENMWVNTAEANGAPGVDDDGNGYVDDIHGYDFANNDGDPMDGNGHGTHCAGTIGAVHDNQKGIAGVMADVSMVGIKFLTDQGSGSTADAISAINYATTIGVDIMSNSWGGGGFSQALKDAIVAAKNQGILFTAAAGNSSSDNNATPHYPSNYDVENVISVAAHNYNDRLASFSCYGSKTVHVAAPGRNILSTTPNNAYEVFSGTSMATPHVSGVLGLYLAHKGKITSANLLDVRNKLMSTSNYVNAIGRRLISGGRVDAYNFLMDIEPARPIKPDPSQWITMPVAAIESNHPYGNNANTEEVVEVPGAKFVRVVLKKMEIEQGYDFLNIKNSAGDLIEGLSGSGTDVYSEYVSGDTLLLNFTSDNSVTKWGYLIEEIQYIP